ncbi:MAG: carboxymuconolactone decarboxylase family protein [Chitinophagales bacterium]|jgi:AhpD family alkylhydroperoxidase|nr:carboxymuconolactone decarboxylase family protein [Chitinophagales bacterium]MCO5281794.1 carboxymuconolactone decarboxylase family protein [Chitinophagales bacterium]HRN95366.1 carboxymuconolactone decarboxylase family protein [Chitinophagales bacterium]HRP40249.1 carboxymuconolactone decarboxylase family protein [Chitinophagales bacterium]
MKQRINVSELVPQAFNVMIEMEKYLHSCDLDHLLRELIKIRVSQINKCAYCLEMHTEDARKSGETEQRIYALSAWEESPLFTDAERAVLAFVEEVTNISQHGVSDKTFANLQQHFSDNLIAQIIITTNQINSWNRIAVATKQFHPIKK